MSYLGVIIVVLSIIFITLQPFLYRRRNYKASNEMETIQLDFDEAMLQLLEDPRWFQPLKKLLKPTEKIVGVTECLSLKSPQQLIKKSTIRMLNRVLSRYTGVFINTAHLTNTSYLVLTDSQLYFVSFQNGQPVQQLVFCREMMSHIRFTPVTYRDLIERGGNATRKNSQKFTFKSDGEWWEVICFHQIYRSPYQYYAEHPVITAGLKTVSQQFTLQTLAVYPKNELSFT